MTLRTARALSKIRKIMSTHKKGFNGKKSGKVTKTKKSFKARPQKSLRFDPNPYGTGPEKKNLDVAQTNYNIPLTASFGSVVLLNGCAQGAGNLERIGRRIAMKSLQLRYTHYPASTATQARIIIFYDRQPNGVTPSALDLIGSGQFEGIVTMGNSDRFVILMDEVTEMSTYDQGHVSGKRYLKMDLEAIFGGTTSGITSINTGAVFIMMANNGSNAVGVATSATFTTRIRFTDA